MYELLGKLLNHLQRSFSSTRSLHGLKTAVAPDIGTPAAAGRLLLLNGSGTFPPEALPSINTTLSAPAVLGTGDGVATDFNLPGGIGPTEIIWMAADADSVAALMIRNDDYTRTGLTISFSTPPDNGAYIYYSVQAGNAILSQSGLYPATRVGVSLRNFTPPVNFVADTAIVFVDGRAIRQDPTGPADPNTWYYDSGLNQIQFGDDIPLVSEVDTSWGIQVFVSGANSDTVDGFDTSVPAVANTIPVRNGSSEIEGNITGASQQTVATRDAANPTFFRNASSVVGPNLVVIRDGTGKMPGTAEAAELATNAIGVEDSENPGIYRVGSSQTDPNSVAIRDAAGKLPGDILGNAATADLADDANTLGGATPDVAATPNTAVIRNGSGQMVGDVLGNASTASNASNSAALGGTPAASYMLKADEIQTASFEFSGEYPSTFTNVGPIFVAPYPIQLLSAVLVVEYEGSGGGYTEVDLLAKPPAGSPATVFTGSGLPRVGGNGSNWGASFDGGPGDRAAVFATPTFVTNTIFYCNITSGASHPVVTNPVSGTLLLRYKRQ